MTTHRKRAWFDNDAFWRDTYDVMFLDTRLNAARDEGAD